MATVVLTPAAQQQFEELPRTIQIRVHGILIELERWPKVSGAKPLRGILKGNFRKRTGDYRVIFRVTGSAVTVWQIGHRDGFYD